VFPSTERFLHFSKLEDKRNTQEESDNQSAQQAL
jgi:hypothetical protein